MLYHNHVLLARAFVSKSPLLSHSFIVAVSSSKSRETVARFTASKSEHPPKTQSVSDSIRKQLTQDPGQRTWSKRNYFIWTYAIGSSDFGKTCL